MKNTKRMLTATMCLCVLLLAVMIGLFFSSCGSDSGVTTALKAHDAQKVCEIYNAQIKKDRKKAKEIKNEILDCMVKVYDDYNDGKSTYDEVYQIIVTVENTQILDHDTIILRYQMLDDLKGSKDAFSSAETYYQQKQWIDCYAKCGEVLSQDTNYSKAQSMADEARDSYLAQLFADADAHVAEGDWSAACRTLENCDRCFADDELYRRKKEEVEAGYAQQIIAQAKAAFGEKKDYEAAIRVLQSSGLARPEITEEIRNYQKYAPVNLYSLDVLRSGEYMNVGEYVDSEDKTSVNNRTYLAESVIHPGCGTLASEVPSDKDEASVTYYLNAEYARLTGVAYRPYSSLRCEKTWGTTGIVEIYGDGVLLYASPDFTQDTYDEYNIDIDIAGVRELKIVVFGSWSELDGWGLVEYHPKACLADVKLYK